MQARMSASSIPGYSSRISSLLIPLASRSRISDTQILCPRMEGFPKHTFLRVREPLAGDLAIQPVRFFATQPEEGRGGTKLPALAFEARLLRAALSPMVVLHFSLTSLRLSRSIKRLG